MTLEIAEQLEEQGKYEQAYEEYKNLLNKKPQDMDLLQRTAHVAMILDKADEAKSYYIKILHIDPKNTMCYEQLMDICFNTDKYKYYVYRGNLHVCQGQLTHAVNDFKKAADKAETEEETLSVRFVLGGLYEQLGKIHPAIDEFLRVSDSDKANREVFIKLANLYEKSDMVSSSVSILERAMEKGFDKDAEIKETLAEYYIKNGTPELATELTSDNLTKARSMMDNGREEQAFELLESIKNDYKKNPTYHSLLAQYYYQKNEYEKSLEAIDEFEKFAKNSPLIYQMRAMNYDELNKGFEAHVNWAKYNILRDNKDVALNEYLFAYNENDSDIELVFVIANLLDTMNDKTRACEFYERLLELEPENKKALERLAEFRESIGDYKQAIKYLETYHQIDNKNAQTIKKLGKFYEKIRNKDKALEYYKKYVSISNAVEDYDNIMQKITKLEGQNSKSYSESNEELGLIDIIAKWFKR